MSANPYKTEQINAKENKVNGPYFIVKITKPTFNGDINSDLFPMAIDAVKRMKKSLDDGNPFIAVPDNMELTYIPADCMEVVHVK